MRFDPSPFLCRGAPTGLQGSSCRDDYAEDGKPSHIAHTGSYTTSPTRQSVWEGVGALPGGVVYPIPAVITIKAAAGEIAAGEALGAVRVRSVRECLHRWTVSGSGSWW